MLDGVPTHPALESLSRRSTLSRPRPQRCRQSPAPWRSVRPII